MATIVKEDLLSSEELIARILEDDLLLVKQAEKLQLDQLLAISAQTPESLAPDFERDRELALELYISDALSSIDSDYAQSIQNETYTANIAGLQYAQQIAAAERKLNLDAEFACKLQSLVDEGEDIDKIESAESLSSREPVGVDPNDVNQKGDYDVDAKIEYSSNEKGKGRLSSPISQLVKQEVADIQLPSYPTCGICMEPFVVTHSPITALRSANSSSRLPFGMRLPCPCDHPYCISCLSTYLQNKLDPEGNGTSKFSAIVFPIKCPECLLSDWPSGISDDVAERILGEADMVQWHHQKILSSLPRLFCPNPKCSSLVEADEDSDDPQASCPSCQQVMCVPCRVTWHTGLTCEEYQALPLDERSPEDRLVLELAKAKRWRRCPNCAVIVELISGCNHMTCRCGFHFCFKCGSPTTEGGKCKRNPPCELWDEELLLDEGERVRAHEAAPVAPPEPPPVPPVPPAPAPAPWRPRALWRPPSPPVQDYDDLDWMSDPEVLCGRHWFTTDMIRNLTCGYCGSSLNSLADLQYHLTYVRHHGVYACCGRFFKRFQDFERHEASIVGRFGGGHAYRMVNE